MVVAAKFGGLPAQVRWPCALQAYLRKASPQIAANKQLEPLLGVFQKLNASKALDHEAFNLLEGLTQHLWDKGLQQYMGRVRGAHSLQTCTGSCTGPPYTPQVVAL